MQIELMNGKECTERLSLTEIARAEGMRENRRAKPKVAHERPRALVAFRKRNSGWQAMTESHHIRRCVARGRSWSTITPQSLVSRILLLLLAVVALAIQTLVVQGHIHLPQTAGQQPTVSSRARAPAAVTDTSGVVADNSANAPRDKYPINEDPSNCPLCQEVAYSGQYVHRAAVLIALPISIAVSFSFIVFSEAVPSLFAATHSWQGRAPPQA
jgi:hypothetical protein